MSAKKIVDDINTEDFITQIELYPALWNVQSEEYSNKLTRRNDWEQVILHFVPNFYERESTEKKEIGALIQTKWKSLRNSYTRELAKQKKEKRGSAASGRKQYIYFDQLSFLGNSCKKSDSLNDSEGEGAQPESIRYETQEELIQNIRPVWVTSKKRKQINEEDETLIAVRKVKVEADTRDNQNKEEDENKLFLLSLLPELRKVPESRRLRTKAQLIDVIIKAQELPISSPPSTSTQSANYFTGSN